MSPEVAVAGVMLAALVVYALLGGADYGGGVWDLLASGPRARAQRELVEHAIGPVWEANHVWLILVLVLLFAGFPVAFAAISTALHIPLTLMLIGIVLRGSAFVFRSYGSAGDEDARRWGRVFAISSTATPVVLGVVIGAITTGRIRVEDGRVTTGFVEPWLGLFPLSVGLFTLAMFTFLAAVYLTVESEDGALREDFRRRALGAAVGVGVMALGVFLLSGAAAPALREGLSTGPRAIVLHGLTGASAVTAIWALWVRRFRVARMAAAAQVALVIVGWGAALYPELVPPDVTIANAAAPRATLVLVLWALGAGALVLLPSLVYLFRVFKTSGR